MTSRSKIPFTPGTQPLDIIEMLSNLPLPDKCNCTWSYHSDDFKRLKFINAACRVHAHVKTVKVRESYYPPVMVETVPTKEGRIIRRPKKDAGAPNGHV